MKKVIGYAIGIVLLCFLIPIVGTSGFQSEEVQVPLSNEENIVENNTIENTYDYKNYQKVKLLHTKTNTIEEMDLDQYLYGVVSSEMPADFQMEALKAQAVVARTYTIYKIIHNATKHGEAAICDDSTCCQAWISKEDRMSRWDENVRESNWNKIIEAVNSTQGKIITYNGEPINAFFHSNSGGTTEIPINVWGGTGYPYLQAVQTAGESEYAQYASEVILGKDEVTQKVKEKHPDIEINWEEEDCIKILEYTESGRVKTLKLGNLSLSGVEVRSLFGLKSTNFEITRENDQIKFSVKGYGHGIGMSQTGADSMAKSGSNYEEIIRHFYVGVEIENL